MADNTIQKPRTVFEQIALGLQVTNENIVEVSKDIASLHGKVDAIYAALFPTTSEPTSAGAEQPIVGGSNSL